MICPHCHISAGFRKLKSVPYFRCQACSCHVSEMDFRERVKSEKKASKSGVIAGRIEIGRGSVWGAGLV